MPCRSCGDTGVISINGQAHLPCACQTQNKLSKIISIECKDCEGTGLGNYFGSTQLKMNCKVCEGTGKVESFIYKEVRPEWEQYWLAQLASIESRASCARGKCAAIIVDFKNRLIVQAYNGPPSRLPNCTDKPCAGVNDKTECQALHAEDNAIAFMGENDNARVLYVSMLPCFKCSLRICMTTIEKVVYLKDATDQRSRDIFKTAGIKLVKGEL